MVCQYGINCDDDEKVSRWSGEQGRKGEDKEKDEHRTLNGKRLEGGNVRR